MSDSNKNLQTSNVVAKAPEQQKAQPIVSEFVMDLKTDTGQKPQAPPSADLNKLINQAVIKVAENAPKKVKQNNYGSNYVDPQDMGARSSQWQEKHEAYVPKGGLRVGNVGMQSDSFLRMLKLAFFGLVIVPLFLLAAFPKLREELFSSFSRSQQILGRNEQRNFDIVSAVQEDFSKIAPRQDSSNQVDQATTAGGTNKQVVPDIPTGQSSDTEQRKTQIEQQLLQLYERLDSVGIFQGFTIDSVVKSCSTGFVECAWSIILTTKLRELGDTTKIQALIESWQETTEKEYLKNLWTIVNLYLMRGYPKQNQVLKELETIQYANKKSPPLFLISEKLRLARLAYNFSSSQIGTLSAQRNELVKNSSLMAKKLVYLIEILSMNAKSLVAMLSIPEFRGFIENDWEILSSLALAAIRTNSSVLGEYLQKQLLVHIQNVKTPDNWKSELNLVNFALFSFFQNQFDERMFYNLLRYQSAGLNQKVEAVFTQYLLGKNLFEDVNIKKYIEYFPKQPADNVTSSFRRIFLWTYFGDIGSAKSIANSLQSLMSHQYVSYWSQLLGFYAASKANPTQEIVNKLEQFIQANPESYFGASIKYKLLIDLRRSAIAEKYKESLRVTGLTSSNFENIESSTSPLSILQAL